MQDNYYIAFLTECEIFRRENIIAVLKGVLGTTLDCAVCDDDVESVINLLKDHTWFQERPWYIHCSSLSEGSEQKIHLSIREKHSVRSTWSEDTATKLSNLAKKYKWTLFSWTQFRRFSSVGFITQQKEDF